MYTVKPPSISRDGFCNVNTMYIFHFISVDFNGYDFFFFNLRSTVIHERNACNNCESLDIIMVAV